MQNQQVQNQEIVIETDSIDLAIRTDFIRSLFAPLMDVIPVTEAGGTSRLRSVSGLTLVDSTYNPYQFERSNALIRQSGIDDFMLCLTLAGTSRIIGPNGKHILLEAGDILLVDLATTGKGIMDAGRNMHVFIPRDTLTRQLGNRRLCEDILFKAKMPMTKILTDFILGFFDVSLALSAEEIEATTQSLVSLLIAALNGASPQSVCHINDMVYNAVLKDRVLQFIDANLTNSELSLEMLMKRFRVSRAHLYRAFEEDGGVITLVRNKRLDMAYRELSMTNSLFVSVTQVAHKLGFSSGNHFTRAFRQRFGVAPNEVRLQDGGIRFQSYDRGIDLYEHFQFVQNTSRQADSRYHISHDNRSHPSVMHGKTVCFSDCHCC